EELGGAEMHSRISGLSDYFARDEYEAIRMGRDIVAHLNWRKLGYGPTMPADEPVHDPEEILGVIPPDLRIPFDQREIFARILDGSRFEEYKAMYGTSILCGWGSIHGFPVGIIANQQGVIFSEEAEKATEFIQLCNRYDVPIVFSHNTTGYMVGKDYEQRGIIKDGAKMVKAMYGTSILCGWGSIHGFPVGIIANQQGVIFSEEAEKATEFIQLCNRYDVPIVFSHNTTGYMVGKDYEQRGIIKDGAKMVNA